MSVGYGRAWDIATATPLADHDPYCAYAGSAGVLLCDCVVLTGHPEYTDDVLHARGGVVRAAT